jgi:hypothetical protein
MFAPMTIPAWFEVAFWSIAVIVSGFLGWFCFEIHGLNRSSYNRPASVQQVWLNFVGAFVGWIALWFLVRQWWGVWRLPSAPAVSVQMTVSDFALALTAFVGISGYLPFTVIGAIQTSVALIQRFVARVMGWLSSTPALTAADQPDDSNKGRANRPSLPTDR